jgi:hypothetical protein
MRRRRGRQDQSNPDPSLADAAFHGSSSFFPSGDSFAQHHRLPLNESKSRMETINEMHSQTHLTAPIRRSNDQLPDPFPPPLHPPSRPFR